MRRSLLVVALLCAALPASAVAKSKFPYVAYIAADDAPLRSGPGDEHYLTDRLERGTKVEIHRHDPGGWYAVRPLPGSFSWVPAKMAEMTDEADVAEVTKEGAVSWVGTRDGQVRGLKWQVELKKGELIEVLGAKRMVISDSEAEEICYRIAPPPGEFRWIQSKYVTRRGADELAEEPHEKPLLKSTDGAVKLVALELPAEVEKEPSLAPAGGLKTDGFVPRKPRQGASGEAAFTAPTSAAAPDSKTTPAAARVTPDAAAPATSGEESPFDARLHELDVALSLAVAREPAAWNLTALREQTVSLMESGTSALDRGRARLLVEKIDEFAEFARRRTIPAVSTTTGSPAPASASAPAKTLSPTPATPADKDSAKTPGKTKGLIDTPARAIGSGLRGSAFAPDIDPRYDGLGWLMPVHSESGNSPAYALTDNQGKVLQYVTPSPGLNLHRYLRTQVGVYGQKGYNTRLLMPQLTAQRVVSLERHRK